MTFPMNSGQDCPRAWEAMPWVLQDSAPPEQSQWLEAHLAHCESCREEFAQQSRLRLAMTLTPDIPVDAEAGLSRLFDRIDASEAPEFPVRRRSGQWLTRALVAVVLIQAIGVGILGAKLWSTSESPRYRTLSEAPAPAMRGAIRVVPDATMAVAHWNALLLALRLQVVDGPNEVGAYLVAPMGPASASRHVLQQLRATQGIRLAEPVTTAP